MKKIVYIICLMICSCLALMSCQDNDDNFGLANGNAAVRVAFTTPDFVQLGTRATSESNIKDITVLQFKEGKMVKQLLLEDKLFSQAVELEGLESMAATTVDEDGILIQNGRENLLVFLANVKVTIGSVISGFDENSTYSDLLAYTASLVDADALGNLQYMPMTGTYYGGITDGVTNQISVTLTRSLAKINFTLNTTNFVLPSGESPEIVVNSIELHNVPLDITFFPQNRPTLPANGLPGEWADVQRPYPATTGNGTDADNFITLSATHNQASNKSTSFVSYMPENARGSYTNIENNKQKIPASITDAVNRVGLTYLLVDLDYATSEGITKNVNYKIYLGGDATGDMNILANTQYNVTTYLYGDGSGAADVDTRITITSLFDPTVINSGTNSLQPTANSYIINPSSVPSNFTIPLTQARNGWRYIHASLKANGDVTDYTKAFDDMIDGNWTIETLWKTWNEPTDINITGTVATGIETASGTETNRYYATLNIPANIPVGNNCVIALKDSDGTIWWTWHLWITDYNPDATGIKNGQIHSYFSEAFTAVGLYNGKKMMDRNLGASITGISDNYTPSQPQTTTEAVKWYGLMYQWGRKDPFTNSANGTTSIATPVYDNSDQQITDGTDGFPKVSNNAVATYRLVDAIRNPMNYYHSGSDSDWTKQDNNLWNITTKTVFDPCPAGWRVPAGGSTAAYNPWAGFGNGLYNSTTSINNSSIWGDNDSGPFPWFAAVSGQTGTDGRLYGATNSLGSGSFTGTADWYGGDKAWYPASGYRHHSSGLLSYMGYFGFYWNCAVTGANSYTLNFNPTGGVSPSYNSSRANGFPIRCVQN